MQGCACRCHESRVGRQACAARDLPLTLPPAAAERHAAAACRPHLLVRLPRPRLGQPGAAVAAPRVRARAGVPGRGGCQGWWVLVRVGRVGMGVEIGGGAWPPALSNGPIPKCVPPAGQLLRRSDLRQRRAQPEQARLCWRSALGLRAAATGLHGGALAAHAAAAGVLRPVQAAPGVVAGPPCCGTRRGAWLRVSPARPGSRAATAAVQARLGHSARVPGLALQAGGGMGAALCSGVLEREGSSIPQQRPRPTGSDQAATSTAGCAPCSGSMGAQVAARGRQFQARCQVVIQTASVPLH